ncbi:hypothetical protein Rhal01_02602 [Rubritalea halochordaticola]|uniref:Uncharacterized protein n=1 Tax=Rubritalea halochordaticola TaxID=714537 RepID=A0ABP9V3A8_9BACT
MKRITLPLLLTLLPLYAEEPKAEAKTDPQDPNVRPAGEVVLQFEHRIEIPQIKRFKSEDGVLELFPGDTVHLEFQSKEGKLVDPKVVAKVTHPRRTISFSMTQDKDMTCLSRSTHIQQTVAFDCIHRQLGSEDFYSTQLIPTEKGLASFDSWSNTVWMLRLTNFEVTDKSAQDVYEEKIKKREEAKKE